MARQLEIVCNLELRNKNILEIEILPFCLDPLFIGLLFQIQDDIIDETQSTEEAGKTTQNDESKNSFVNLLGLDGAIKSANDLAKKCENSLNELDENLKDSL